MGNMVMVKLDPENDKIKTSGGTTLYVDTSYEPEKHITVTGTVVDIPKKLKFDLKGFARIPWVTDIEIQKGDKVVMYYLAVQNCFRPEHKRFIRDGDDRYVFISYRNIYAAIRNNTVIPVNGYVLIEPIEDPEIKKQQDKLIKPVVLDNKSRTKVVHGRVVYVGAPVKEYLDSDQSDENIDISPGDEVIMRKVSDIPLEYELHATIDRERKLYRTQRPDILAVL